MYNVTDRDTTRVQMHQTGALRPKPNLIPVDLDAIDEIAVQQIRKSVRSHPDEIVPYRIEDIETLERSGYEAFARRDSQAGDEILGQRPWIIGIVHIVLPSATIQGTAEKAVIGRHPHFVLPYEEIRQIGILPI